jgi:hypothetical protein
MAWLAKALWTMAHHLHAHAALGSKRSSVGRFRKTSRNAGRQNQGIGGIN